ncbi:hypothetical protein ACWGA9_06320 [Streptomyces sp. NPDC054950]
MTIGMREWEWSPELHDYQRVGEYLCGWREGVRAQYLKTGELFVNQSFSARRFGRACPTSLTLAAAA